MAQLTEPYELPQIEDDDEPGDFNGIWEAQEKEVEKLRKDAPTDPEEEGIVGAIITFPVADGKAMYRVTDEDPLTLQHIPFGDKYRIPDAHIRGLRRQDIVQKMKQSEIWRD